MPVIENTSPFAYQAYEKWDHLGNEYYVVVARGTFELVSGLPMPLASVQTPICFGDKHSKALNADVFYSQLDREGDLVLAKPGTDICVLGTSYYPGEDRNAIELRHSWNASVQIGPYKKELLITGRRRFIRNKDQWIITEPEHAASVRLDYHHAFGGYVPISAQYEQKDRYIAYRSNPIGHGWLPSDEDLKLHANYIRDSILRWRDRISSLVAPQIVDAHTPLTSPYDRVEPAGISPIARWWSPRHALQGTLDENWERERHPYPPEDFDMRFYQCAHPDLITTTYLQGGEDVHLSNIGWLAQYTGKLPSVSLSGLAVLEGGKQTLLPLVLDTVRLDTDIQKAVLLWRIALHKSFPIKRFTLMATALGNDENLKEVAHGI